MSVIVKGMEMPKKCICCPLSHWNKLDELTGCELHQKHIPNAEKEFWEKDRPDWCPLVEVPTPHRRLIEEPKQLSFAGLPYISPTDFVGTAEYFVDQIKSMPTIIEAEDGT